MASKSEQHNVANSNQKRRLTTTTTTHFKIH
jgi:hypothetical protein